MNYVIVSLAVVKERKRCLKVLLPSFDIFHHNELTRDVCRITAFQVYCTTLLRRRRQLTHVSLSCTICSICCQVKLLSCKNHFQKIKRKYILLFSVYFVVFSTVILLSPTRLEMMESNKWGRVTWCDIIFEHETDYSYALSIVTSSCSLLKK